MSAKCRGLAEHLGELGVDVLDAVDAAMRGQRAGETGSSRRARGAGAGEQELRARDLDRGGLLPRT